MMFPIRAKPTGRESENQGEYELYINSGRQFPGFPARFDGNVNLASVSLRMIFEQTKLRCVLCGLERETDNRGLFARLRCQREFTEHDINPRLVNASVSIKNHKEM